MKNYFNQFNHQKEKSEHSHKNKDKTKDCSSCKKQVPKKNHKCCSYSSDINSENQDFNQNFYQDYYFNSAFWESQNYFMEIDPYDPLHIVQYFPFQETYDNSYMNEYYKYLFNLYDYYEREESKKIKESKIPKSIESEEPKNKPKIESKINLKNDHKIDFETNQVKDSSQFEYFLEPIADIKKNSKKQYEKEPKMNEEKNSKKNVKRKPKKNQKLNGKKNVRNNLKKNKKKNGKKLKEKVVEVEIDIGKMKVNETKKISNEEEEKFLEEFKKRLLNRNYIYY